MDWSAFPLELQIKIVEATYIPRFLMAQVSPQLSALCTSPTSVMGMFAQLVKLINSDPAPYVITALYKLKKLRPAIEARMMKTDNVEWFRALNFVELQLNDALITNYDAPLICCEYLKSTRVRKFLKTFPNWRASKKEKCIAHNYERMHSIAYTLPLKLRAHFLPYFFDLIDFTPREYELSSALENAIIAQGKFDLLLREGMHANRFHEYIDNPNILAYARWYEAQGFEYCSVYSFTSPHFGREFFEFFKMRGVRLHYRGILTREIYDKYKVFGVIPDVLESVYDVAPQLWHLVRGFKPEKIVIFIISAMSWNINLPNLYGYLKEMDWEIDGDAIRPDLAKIIHDLQSHEFVRLFNYHKEEFIEAFIQKRQFYHALYLLDDEYTMPEHI
jgi:hypothetical protein